MRATGLPRERDFWAKTCGACLCPSGVDSWLGVKRKEAVLSMCLPLDDKRKEVLIYRTLDESQRPQAEWKQPVSKG